MNRFAKFLCDPAKVVKLIAMLFVGVALIVYVYFQVAGGFDDEVITESAMLVTLNDTISCDACIFRDETVIEKPADGVIVTLVAEGQRISKGQLIANVYPGEDEAVMQDDINRLNRRIEILEDSSVDKQFVISDLQKIYDDISGNIYDVSKSSAYGDLSGAVETSEKLIVGLNKRDLILETEFDYSDELDTLIAERNDLERRINSVTTPIIATNSSGYFYGDVDGYENVFDIAKVDSVNLDNFEQYLSAKPDEDILSSGGVKVVNDIIWYLVCSFDAEEKSKIKEGRTYALSFPENGGYEINMKLSKIISKTDSSEALAVFRVNVLPGQFNYKRFQQAEIVIKQHEGISVPKKALRSINGVEGVYILVGDVVRFRSVKRISEMDDYYIVSMDTENQVHEDSENEEVTEYVKPISLYDNVIVSGKDLFDGKIIT